MVLKFGVLVLLLAICGVFAEKKAPTFPTADFASTLKRISHLPRGLHRAHYSPARTLLSSSLSSPFQYAGGTCAWDDHSKECTLSISGMKSLLEKSASGFAKIVVERLICVEKTSMEDCNREKACLWDNHLQRCDYIDFRKGHEDSSCAKVAPHYFDFFEALTQCGRQYSDDTCKMTEHCEWSYTDNVCNPDMFFVLTGIEDFDQKFNQVMRLTEEDIYKEYDSLFESPDFTWQSILDHEPSPAECPADIEPLVCKAIDAFYRTFVGPQIYCDKKYDYDSSIECNADDFCAWIPDFAEFCLIDPSIMNAAYLSYFLIVSDSLPDAVDKTFFDNFYTCFYTIDKESCRGNCMWTPLINHCNVKFSLLADLTAEASKNSTDGFCTYLSVDGSSECRSQFDKVDCQQSDLCRWSSLAGCERKEEFYLLAAADRDPSLKWKYQRLKRQCSSHTTEKACVM